MCRSTSWLGRSGSGEASSAPNDQSVPDSNKVLGIALGNFDAEHAKSYMKAHKIRGYEYRGYTLYPCASCDELSVVFIDSSTVAFWLFFIPGKIAGCTRRHGRQSAPE